MKYLGIIMALVYVGAGIAVLLNTKGSSLIPSNMTIPLGVVLIAYGAFRGYNSFKKYHE